MKLVKAIELQTNYCTGYTDIWVKRKCGVVYYSLRWGKQTGCGKTIWHSLNQMALGCPQSAPAYLLGTDI